MNPFLLAGLVFGVIGLIQTAMDNKADEDAAAIAAAKPKKPKAKKAAQPSVVVPNVVVNLPSETAIEKPIAEVPTHTQE